MDRSEPKPSVGRIVHYRSVGSSDLRYPPETHPALITHVGQEDRVSLIIFYGRPSDRSGFFFMHDVEFNAEIWPGCWSWPPRVP